MFTAAPRSKIEPTLYIARACNAAGNSTWIIFAAMADTYENLRITNPRPLARYRSPGERSAPGNTGPAVASLVRATRLFPHPEEPMSPRAPIPSRMRENVLGLIAAEIEFGARRQE